MIYKSQSGQSLFDIALMLNGELDSIVSFAIQSGVDINSVVPPNKAFTYTTGKAITDWAFKNNYIFSTANNNLIRVLSTNDGRLITTDLGYFISVSR